MWMAVMPEDVSMPQVKANMLPGGKQRSEAVVARLKSAFTGGGWKPPIKQPLRNTAADCICYDS